MQTSDPWRANLWPKFEILTVWGLYFHISAPINVKFGSREPVRSPVPNFTFIGASCHTVTPAGRKNLFLDHWGKQYRHAGLLVTKTKQELSYRQQIARKLRTQYAEGIYRHTYYTVTLKYRLKVTQGHWKRNHWIGHTRLSSNRVIWRWILLWPWSVI